MFKPALAALSLYVVSSAMSGSLVQPQPQPTLTPAGAMLRAGISPYQLAVAGGTSTNVVQLAQAAGGDTASLSRAALRQRLLAQLDPALQQRLELLEAGRRQGLSGPVSLAASTDEERVDISKQIRRARRAARIAGQPVTATTGISADLMARSDVQTGFANLQNLATIQAAYATQAGAPAGNP